MKRDRDKLAERRRLALQRIAEGASASVVAKELGTTVRSVRRWIKSQREGGDAALASRRNQGRPRELTLAQRERLDELLHSGPRACGIDYPVWTAELIQRLIEVEFGVSYHVNHITRVLDRMALTVRRLNNEAPWRR